MSLLYSMYQQSFLAVIGLLIITIWTLVWKGLALWHAGKNQQKNWFIAILLLNTLGLLPIIYLLWFKPEEEADINKEEKVKKQEKVKPDIIEISEDDLKDDLEEKKPKKKTSSKKSVTKQKK